MDLELTPEQGELRAVAEQMLDRRSPFTRARTYFNGGGSVAELSSQMAELGWYAVGLEEDDPFGLTGLALLAEQCGWHATPNVLVDTAVAARLAASAEGDGLVARVAAGQVPAALCVLEPCADWSLKGLETALVGGKLSGLKVGVEHAGEVDVLVVLTDARVAFVAPHADGVAIEREYGIDPTAAPSRVSFDVVEPLAVLPDAPLGRCLAIGAVATAAEAIGAASRAVSMVVEYAKERHQFGRPIGAFQAVQHILAEAHVQRETGWAAVLYAAAALDEDLPDALQAAAVAKAHGSRASRAAVEAALQAFGGVAFTWEHDAHLLQRRVLRCERRFGDASHHERALGARLAGLEAGAGLTG